MRSLVALAALALVAGTAEGQIEPRRFSVGAHFGTTTFDDAAALKSSPFAGIDAMYAVPLGAISNRLDLGVGFNLNASVPITRYDQFPAVAFDVGDTTFLYGVSQRVQLLDYGLQATLGASLGRLRLYGLGGAGLYTIFLDPKQEGAIRSFTRPAMSVGAGLNFAVARTIGLRTEVRNASFLKYDRDRLDPTLAYAQDRRIGDEYGPPVKEKSTVNNLRFSLVFSYIPGGGGSDDRDTEEERQRQERQ